MDGCSTSPSVPRICNSLWRCLNRRVVNSSYLLIVPVLALSLTNGFLISLRFIFMVTENLKSLLEGWPACWPDFAFPSYATYVICARLLYVGAAFNSEIQGQGSIPGQQYRYRCSYTDSLVLGVHVEHVRLPHVRFSSFQ